MSKKKNSVIMQNQFTTTWKTIEVINDSSSINVEYVGGF